MAKSDFPPLLDAQLRPVIIFIYRAPVAQLDRASGYEPEGREFESPRARHSNPRNLLSLSGDLHSLFF